MKQIKKKKEESESKIVPFLPVYCSGKNKLLRYEEVDFDDGCGHLAIVRNAVYLDKSSNEQSMVAQVIWK